MNPYEVLGVHRGANETEIRRAYRHKAKDAHPDAGGDIPAWLELQSAFEVLTDPARRKRYDDTGSIEAPPKDTTRENALGLISELIGRVLTNDQEPFEADLVEALLGCIDAQITQCDQQNESNARAKARIAKLRGRFTGKVDGDNLFESVLNGHAAAIEHGEQVMKNKRAVCDAARSMIADYQFMRDIPQHMPHQVVMMNASTLGSIFRRGL